MPYDAHASDELFDHYTTVLMTTPTSPSSPPTTITISRLRVGLIAGVCLSVAAGLQFGTEPNVQKELWVGAFGRVGLVMTVLWFALPTKHRPAAWANIRVSTLIGCLLALLVFARSPRLLVQLLPVFGGLAAINYFTRPRSTKRDQRPDRSSWSS